MTKITVKLSQKGIDKAIKQLQDYKKSLREKSRLLIEKLGDYGLQVCRAKVVEMDIYDTGRLLSTISGYYNSETNSGFITVDCDYAVFVEFGTGTRGIGKPYPAGEIMAEVGYQYMGGTKYVTLLDGRIGWYYPTEEGTWRFTEGLPSRPFMYETALDMRRNLDSLIKEVFR